MRFPSITASSLAMALALSPSLLGGERPAAVVKPVDALIVREGVLPSGGVAQVSALRIVAPDKISALEEFFPNYRKRPSSDLAGGWEAGYRVYFNFPGGETVCLTVSENENGRHWTVGHGDFATRGNFVRFVDELSR